MRIHVCIYISNHIMGHIITVHREKGWKEKWELGGRGQINVQEGGSGMTG